MAGCERFRDRPRSSEGFACPRPLGLSHGGPCVTSYGPDLGHQTDIEHDSPGRRRARALRALLALPGVRCGPLDGWRFPKAGGPPALLLRTQADERVADFRQRRNVALRLALRNEHERARKRAARRPSAAVRQAASKGCRPFPRRRRSLPMSSERATYTYTHTMPYDTREAELNLR
jgi:hypothetical protein